MNAKGRSDGGGVGFVGGQVGYEFSRGSAVLPAFEVEGFYIDTGTRRATLQNPHERLPEHTFDNTLPMNTTVFRRTSFSASRRPIMA